MDLFINFVAIFARLLVRSRRGTSRLHEEVMHKRTPPPVAAAPSSASRVPHNHFILRVPQSILLRNAQNAEKRRREQQRRDELYRYAHRK